MEVICSNCKQLIDQTNYNVSTDIAYCENCDLRHSLAELLDDADIDFSILDNPPKGTFSIDSWDSKKVGCRFSRKILIFLLPFTCVWSGFSMTGIYIGPLMRGELQLGNALFGIPFLIGSIILWSIIIMSLFGKLTVKIQQKVGQIIYGVGEIGWKRTFFLSEVEKVCIKESDVRINNQIQDGICIETADKEIIFGTAIKEEYKEYIYAYLKKEIKNG